MQGLTTIALKLPQVVVKTGRGEFWVEECLT